MATITTNTFLDDGTARTAGEAWTLNGGILTIRTDTRWHVSSPSSMLGSIAAITVSATLGGGVYIDATKVRWMAYDTGSGNVPSIGTNITQSGVTSSYLLGVYSSLTASPTSVGDLMPTSGFIKFREVEGAFVAGALSGIGAVSSSPDVTGWLEVVRDISTTATIPRLGSFITRGDWFYLGTTNGSADQTFQVPTNGGGSGTHVPGVWIETSQNSVGRALSNRQKLDDIVEKLFENIKNNFNIKKLKYSGPNSDPERNKREYYIYEFEKDSFIKTVEETECTFHGNSYDIGDKTYKIFLGDDDITRLVNKYLIEDIHDFFISKENNRDSEKDKRKDDE